MPCLMHEAPGGYTLGKCLSSSSRSDVYEAVHEGDGAEVVLKYDRRTRSAGPQPSLQREFRALQRIQTPGVPRALALEGPEHQLVLVLERIPGVSLRQALGGNYLELDRWLGLAAGLASTLARVHEARLLHKNITLGNVLVDLESSRAWLVDFALAADLGEAERQRSGRAGLVEGTVLYMAPEQTGRMNRGCDARSDLYSLGALLYHALTGHPPFDSTDPLELIHAHIARLPKTPTERRPNIPRAISEILLRLLAKEPDERYPNAAVLYQDLLACSEQLAQRGSIDDDFSPASACAPAAPRFQARLYGRARETSWLAERFDDAARGQATCVFLRGLPGAGKSALVDVLRTHVNERDGYVAAGKFDLFRDRPYAGWVAALESLLQQLLLESDAQLADWRQRLRTGLGGIAQALVDLVPDLGFIVGEVPPVPRMGPRETQARLALALERLLAVCATKDHPLVLVLDDLQWSDAASRFLLEEVLASRQSMALLVISAFRADEVDDSHPVAGCLKRIEARGSPLHYLDVGPLTREACTSMLCDALGRSREDCEKLPEWVQRKTGNSPFLVREFIGHMHAQRFLRYQPGRGWVWDRDQLAAASVPDGAVALLTAKIDRLDLEARETLTFASCVGNEFDRELLCELSQRDRLELERALYKLSDAGLIGPCREGFRFLHDRIRETAQSLLSEDERSRLHFSIGELILERVDAEELRGRVFEVTDHLNRGRRHRNEKLRVKLMELNLRAGKRALATGAASTAASYLSSGRSLFSEQDWESHREVGFELHLASAETTFQRRKYREALTLLEEIEGRNPSELEFAQIASKRIQVFAITRPPEECVRYSLQCLRKMGLRWPLRPSRIRAWLSLRHVQFLMRGREGDQLWERVKSVEPQWFAPLLIMGPSGAAMVRVNIRISVLSVCFAMRMYLKHGWVSQPGFTLATYGLYLYLVLDDAELAERTAQAALDWIARVPDPRYGPRSELMVYGLLRPWLQRRRQAIAPLKRIAEAALEIGDPEFASYAHFMDALYRAYAGDPVEDSLEHLRQLETERRNLGAPYSRVYRLLLDASEARDEFASALTDLEGYVKGKSNNTEPYARTLAMMVLCVYGRHELAFEQSETVKDELLVAVPWAHVADHLFYRGVCAASLAMQSRGWKARQYRRAFGQARRHLHRWARGGPDFVHMACFLDAEQARVRGDVVHASNLYAQAAKRARQQEYPHHAALAHERCAQMLLEKRRETQGAECLRDAIAMYSLWGAEPKAAALQRERKALLGLQDGSPENAA